MRHRKSGKKLGRTWEHRKAMFRNMARSLIVHERIRTTFTKAKELSKIVDRLVTLALENDLSARRQAYRVLENHKLVQKLFNEIGPKFSGGMGGYTRVVKFASPRVGDNAPMALIEFKYFKAQFEDKDQLKTAAPAAKPLDAEDKPVPEQESAMVAEAEATEAPEAQGQKDIATDHPEEPVAEEVRAEQQEEISGTASGDEDQQQAETEDAEPETQGHPEDSDSEKIK